MPTYEQLKEDFSLKQDLTPDCTKYPCQFKDCGFRDVETSAKVYRGDEI